MTVRRQTTAGVVAWLALAAAVAGPVPAQAAATDISVTLDQPSAGATVSGDAVKVTYTVTSAAGLVVGWTGAKLAGDYQSDYLGTTCETGCAVTATFDTTAPPSAPTASDAADRADGPQQVTVSASTTGGQSTSAATDVIVDNQRPSEALGAPQPDAQTEGSYEYTATDRFHLDVYPTAHDGGSIASTTFHYFSGGTQAAVPLTPPAASGDPWTLDLDTSGWSGGSGSGWVRSTDERGISSIGTMVYYVVDRGMTLTGPALSGTVDDFTLDAVPLEYSYPSGRYPSTFPVEVATYLDGALAERHSLVGVYTGDPPGTVTARSGGRTPPGVHDLRYVVTDNRGVSSEVSYHLTVDKTLDLSWTGGPGTAALPGQLQLSGTADSVDTPITRSTFYVDDTVLDFWTCTTTDCPYHLDGVGKGQLYPETYTPGPHRIRWEVGTRDGLPLTVAGTITVLPYARATVARHRPATYGRLLTLAGRATVTGGRAAANATVRLQRRPADGSGRWRTLATSRAGSTGGVAFTVRTVRTSQYRMVVVTDPGRWAGTAGPVRTVKSRADLRLKRRPAGGKLSSLVRVRGTVAPARPATRVYLQELRRHRWVVAASARPASDGSFVLRYRIVSQHRSRVRVLRPASPGLLVTRTAGWWITTR